MTLKYSIVILILCTLSVIIFVTIIEQNFNVENRNSERLRLRPARFPDSKLMDLQDFKYVIGATCNASALVWIVTSYSGDPTTRSALRRAYPNDELQKLGIHRVFLLGMLNGEASRKTHVTQDSIYDESLKFKDIVQGNFQEAYRNLTYKHLMGLRWAVNTCHHANYIMKMDDDIVVNLYDILNILQTRGTIENTLMGAEWWKCRTPSRV
ncbi:UDP-GalNAc:beta-1,3-N-acetylgalactosaminyltransferase 1 isoform X3 [Cephus cinctus]|uniref:Hexosyltransferase n=1 Tax=Cephus cinctus TaxID=211228 RepID=A0AAJ7VXP9_CEPCN|nr:UDP-GalNAc:beta-1,3-N-acetylgalactosaminyltransferase 1 isoform X3 [Cephus cinctus]